ncbi:hypothetical protein I302_101229 [Kwoniella bestiolae CBS 10118]|uniref:Uncharacterized protein n=1 Tax=Kwoniella bestiolae CBS 10118 TaxID=1296100 RepID=A0A1B9G7D7_9TREE|nr:hypothetical protein I302_04602 [Kwoniella bestiolae CBS 10118]OCF26911.1 hypothetical protein I302_04602 [Kwoniella bestiolae CBS 10118]
MKPFAILLIIAIQALAVFSFSFPYDFLANSIDQFDQNVTPQSIKSLSKEADSMLYVLRCLSTADWGKIFENMKDNSKDECGKHDGHRSNSEGGPQEEEHEYFMNWDDLPETIKQYIEDHPYQSAFYVINGVVFIAPGLVWGPVLWLLGFSGIGPAAASAASFAQSLVHPVVSKGVFAVFQSAKMGGYGVRIMDITVRTGMGIFGGGCWFGGCFDGDDNGGNEGEEASEGEGDQGGKNDGGRKRVTGVSRFDL